MEEPFLQHLATKWALKIECKSIRSKTMKFRRFVTRATFWSFGTVPILHRGSFKKFPRLSCESDFQFFNAICFVYRCILSDQNFSTFDRSIQVWDEKKKFVAKSPFPFWALLVNRKQVCTCQNEKSRRRLGRFTRKVSVLEENHFYKTSSHDIHLSNEIQYRVIDQTVNQLRASEWVLI